MLQIKRWGHCIILIAIAVELILWPSLENLIGCGMTLICWIIFSKIGLNETTIKEHIFSWLVFLSMSLYRILPLLATLLECHSIGYMPIFNISFSFLSCNKSKESTNKLKNKTIQMWIL